MTALTNVPELVDALPTLTSRATLTGKCLYRCDSKERLKRLGVEDSLVSETFMYDYLMSWKDVGVPMSFLVSTPTTTTATASLTAIPLVRTVNFNMCVCVIDLIIILLISLILLLLVL